MIYDMKKQTERERERGRDCKIYHSERYIPHISQLGGELPHNSRAETGLNK